MNNDIIITPEMRRAIAKDIGSRTSERKAQSSRANLEAANRARTEKSEKCDCSSVKHRSTCKVYRRNIKRQNRIRNAAKLAALAASENYPK